MKALIAEDDAAVLQGLREILKSSGWNVEYATDGKAALAKIDGLDLLITDLRLPEMDGLELLQEARKRRPGIQVILMTGYGTIPSAVDAMRKGARAYLTKPFDPEELLFHMREVAETLRLRDAASRFSRGEMVGSSLPMQKVYREIDLAAASDAPALVSGETGTGKELAALAIHLLSLEKAGPYIAVNMGALPKDLIESELFGHERGAFTGAAARKRGAFVLADGGTIFLDELTSLPHELQPKLLRAIETKEIRPLGSEQPHKVEVRIIAATNADIENMVKKQSFRDDLYYRLNVHRIHMPPLRERPEDIPVIVRALLDRATAKSEDSTTLEISAGALASLVNRPWPGNVRELANVLEKARARRSADGSPRIGIEHIDPDPQTFSTLPFKTAKEKAAEEWSKQTIRSALLLSGGNISKAASLLKINQNSLFRLIKRYKLK
jgi:DNA-binding NtrC family response regulator